MKVNTNYKGIPRVIGDVIEVPEDVAVRWNDRGLALISKKDLIKKGADENVLVPDLCDNGTIGDLPGDAPSKSTRGKQPTTKKSK